jgi:NitT/TauT family transport system substrate-binding protein
MITTSTAGGGLAPVAGAEVHRRIRRGALTAVAAAAVLVSGACSSSDSGTGGGGGGKSLSKVTFAVVVATPDPGQTFAYVPIGAGFFKKAGLDVSISFNAGAAAGVQQVAAGKAQFGLASPEAIWNAISAGAKITAFATNVTTSIYSTGVLDSSSIQSVADLKGKKIGVRNLTSGAYPSAQASMAEGGATGVKYVTVGLGGQAAQALRAGQVEALVTSDTDWVAIANQGVKVRDLARSTAQSLPADLLYTTTDYYNAHKDTVVQFARAIFQSTAFAKANPEQAEKYYEQVYPDAAKAAPAADNIEVMQARVGSQELTPGMNGQWGYIQMDKYEQLMSIDLQYKTIKEKVDLSKVFNGELISKFNDPAISGSAPSGTPTS